MTGSIFSCYTSISLVSIGTFLGKDRQEKQAGKKIQSARHPKEVRKPYAPEFMCYVHEVLIFIAGFYNFRRIRGMPKCCMPRVLFALSN